MWLPGISRVSLSYFWHIFMDKIDEFMFSLYLCLALGMASKKVWKRVKAASS